MSPLLLGLALAGEPEAPTVEAPALEVTSEPVAPRVPSVDLAFAEHLLDSGDAEAAWLEFTRAAFLLPPGPEADRARFRAGEALWAQGDDQAALEAFEAGRTAALRPELFRLGEAESLYRLGRYADARRALAAVQSPELTAAAGYRSGWAALRQGEADAALSALEATPPADPLGPPAQRFAAELRALPPLPHRSPAAAGVLSAALPGAGQLYAGEARDTPAALLINGALIGGTVLLARDERYGAAAGLGVLALGFYSGNIYAAVNSAHRFNRRHAQARLDALTSRYELTLGLAAEGDDLEVRVGE